MFTLLVLLFRTDLFYVLEQIQNSGNPFLFRESQWERERVKFYGKKNEGNKGVLPRLSSQVPSFLV
jgi:hypothetical protein